MDRTDEVLTCDVMKVPSSPTKLFGRKRGLLNIRDGGPKLLQKTRREQTCTVIKVPSSSRENNFRLPLLCSNYPTYYLYVEIMVQ